MMCFRDRHACRNNPFFIPAFHLTAFRIFVCIPVLIQTTHAFEAGAMRQPESCLIQQKPEPDHTDNVPEHFTSVICRCSMVFYSNVLRPVISSGCPCYPSCSEYMAQAILEYGFPAGLVLGLERLLHEYGEFHYGITIHTSRGLRLYDPIENNTFWWRSKQCD